MNFPEHIPEHYQALLRQLVGELVEIPGVAAVVLGGSYASRTQRRDSDVDIGLYYLAEAPFDITRIRRVAESIADRPPTVTGFYEWGAWVNGGAWIHTAAGKVDFLYRNLNQIERAIENAQIGIVEHDYDQQPTHGFFSVIYLAETEICVPLYDPQLHIARLKQMVKPYPQKLKEKVIADSLWSAEFTLLHASSFAKSGDVYNTVGCLTRASSNLTQALFALNERYFLNDKWVMKTLAGFALLPKDYLQQLTRILAHPGETAAELTETVSKMLVVWQSVVDLTAGNYQPRFNITA